MLEELDQYIETYLPLRKRFLNGKHSFFLVGQAIF